MKKIFILIFSAFVGSFVSAQQILLFTQTFENNQNGIVFDVPGPDSITSNSGANDWIINNLYNGQSVYPNTTPEDSTTAGDTIFQAPHSHYLHIHDTVNPSGAANANWNTHSASDRFCTLSSSFCSLSF